MTALLFLLTKLTTLFSQLGMTSSLFLFLAFNNIQVEMDDFEMAQPHEIQPQNDPFAPE